MIVIGLNATKSHLYVVKTVGSEEAFQVEKNNRLTIDPSNWVSLREDLISMIRSFVGDETSRSAAIHRCQSGTYGANPETIKAEGIAELVCQELCIPAQLVTPSAAKKLLGCNKKKEWEDKAKALFNPTGSIKYFSNGYNGAITVAYGVYDD